MERRPVPRIVKLRLVSKHIKAHVQRTAEILSWIYLKFKLFEMPSFLTDLPSLFFFFFFLFISPIFFIET